MQRHELAGFFFQMYKTKNQEIVKKFWKYIAIATVTAAMVPFTACDDDSELGPKDKANYEANFAYCLESDNSYSTLSYRYSGKIIETDVEVLQLTPVRFTKPAPAKTTIEIAIDPTLVDEYNAANGTDYVALTDVTIVNSVMTIAAGQYLSADSIKIDLNGNRGFVENGKNLLLPVVIKAADNGVSISKSSRVFVAFNYSANVVSIKDGLFQAGEDESLWEEKMKNVEVEAISSIFTADANTTIKFEVDNSLVAGYNEANGTELFSMEGVTIEDAVILPGEKSAKIRFNVPEYSELKTGYVVPVRIVSIEGDGAIVNESADIAYFTICAASPKILPENIAAGTKLTPGDNWVLKVNGETEYDYYGTKYSWADGMFDNDSWSGNNLDTGDVIEIDLGEVKTVTTVSIEYYDWYYGVKSYQSIRTSPDGVKWTDWKEIPDRSSVGTHYLTFSYPAETRYIELVLGDYAYSSHYGTYMCNIFVYAK